MRKSALIALIISLTLVITSCESRGEGYSGPGSHSEPMSSSSSTSSAIMPSEPPSSEEPSSNPTVGNTTDEPVEEEKPKREKNPALTMDEIVKLDTKKMQWGQGLNVDEHNRPISCPIFQEKYGKYDTFFIRELDNKIYLTFDEGYENGFTAPLLDVLKQKDTKAVFFVTLEYVKSQPDLVKRMIDEGHIVGNHSAGHPMYHAVTLEEATKATMDLHQYMLDNFDYEMTLFRFPAGEYNEQTLALVQSLGYETLFWSFAYADWDATKQMNPDDAFTRVSTSAHKGGIYLFHAVSETNVAIMADVIDNFREQGYEILAWD